MTGVRGSRLQAGKRNSGATGSTRPTAGVDSMHRPYRQDALPFLCPTNCLCLNKFLCFYPQNFLKSLFTFVFESGLYPIPPGYLRDSR